MSPALVRPAVLRQTGRLAARRFESTTSAKAAEAAKDSANKASEYSQKAAEGLSKVSSSAGPAITGAAKGLASSLTKFGGRTAKLVGFVERQIPHVVYYSKVGAELSRIVFRGQGMTPPSAQVFQSYWQNVIKSVQNPSTLFQAASKGAAQPTSLVQRAQNISRAQLVAGGVIAAECLGFFTVGEMIGRFKVVGYHGEVSAEHH